MTTVESNRCYACGKLFCCADCCIVHIRKKHSCRESECPLCRSEKLMVKNFGNAEFVCHVVFHHLPLRCHLCGINLNNCEELQSLGFCNRRLLIQPVVESRETYESQEEDSPSLNKTPWGQTSAIKHDFNGNFGDFSSPPELFSRHTSTPMHVNLVGLSSNFEFKTPRSPNFSLKTPKTKINKISKNLKSKERSCIDDDDNASSLTNTNCRDGESLSSESNYLSLSRSAAAIIDRTPLRSILTNRSSSMSENSGSFARSRKLGAMQKLDEEMGIEAVVDMELTDPQGVVITEKYLPDTENHEIQQKDSGKKVRFSDQFEINVKSEIDTTRPSSPNATESEEFFEARESISEMSIAVVKELSLSSVLINRENEENVEREKGSNATDDKTPELLDSVNRNSEANSSSSKVIMMVVVEKNGSVNSEDLVPLIGSSLKKLEGIGSSFSKNTADYSTPGKSKDFVSGNSVVTADSYTSISSIECFTTPDSTISVSENPRRMSESSNSLGSSVGIFSAMANAMRVAFRSLSGTSPSSNLSREPMTHQQNSSSRSSNLVSNVTSPNVLTSLAAALVPRPAKRSRDAADISPMRSPESTDSVNDARSPVAKKPRGWCKIRAREPIARMRQVTSPRGVSSETQCFQQGSLYAGETIIPLPNRAHQSTQTD